MQKCIIIKLNEIKQVVETTLFVDALSCADQHYSPNTRGVEFGNCGTSNDVEYIPCTTE